MKAITVLAPYGSFIAAGVKTIETRGRQHPWRAAIGQTIAVHQSKRWSPGWLKWFGPDDWQINALDELNVALDERVNGSGYYRAHRRDLPLGAVVATCTVMEVVPIGACGYVVPHICESSGALLLHGDLDGPEPTEVDVSNQESFGDFTPGRWALLLDNIDQLSEPVPCRGFQGLWNLPAAVAGDFGDLQEGTK